MGLFKNVPSSKKSKQVWDKILGLSHELKCIIVSHQCVDFRKVNLGGLEYALFMYDLEMYRQVMTRKYSGFYIEATIRTIFNSMESSMRSAGNNISGGQMFTMYVKLSNTLHQLYGLAEKNGMNGLHAVATYLCSDECGMSTQEIEENEELVIKIANHFEKIVNLVLEPKRKHNVLKVYSVIVTILAIIFLGLSIKFYNDSQVPTRPGYLIDLDGEMHKIEGYYSSNGVHIPFD